MDRVWVAEVILAARNKDGTAVDAGPAGGRPLGWREDVKQAARTQGASRREAEALVEQFEERKRTMKARAAAILAAVGRGKKGKSNGEGGAGGHPTSG